MVAASAAIKFKTHMSLAIAIAGVLVHPNFVDLMAKAAQGQPVDFIGIPVTAVKYTYTVIPALCMTWILSYIERWVDKITPAVTKNFLKPMLIVLIAAPIAIMLIGPIGIWIGSGISSVVYTIHSYLGWLSVAIMGALWPLLVITGRRRSGPTCRSVGRRWRSRGAPATRNCARRRWPRRHPRLWRAFQSRRCTAWRCG